MGYFAKPNYEEYDEKFDTNINPIELICYSNAAKFISSIHQNFIKSHIVISLLGIEKIYPNL